MKLGIRGIRRFLSTGALPLLIRTGMWAQSWHRAAFLSALSSSGLLARFASGPLSLESIASLLGCAPNMRRPLESWLNMGVALKLLKYSSGAYAIRSSFVRKLSDPKFAPFAASLQSLTRFDYRVTLEMPERARSGRQFSLAEQPGIAVAEMSRILAPLLIETIRDAIPRAGSFHMLDAGCGTAQYILFACSWNPDLTALGVELQPAVARAAAERLEQRGLSARAGIQAMDVGCLTSESLFDLVLMNLVVHYAPFESRIAVFRHMHRLLKPGGRILITNQVLTSEVQLQWLNLWGEMTEGCGSLPSLGEMTAHLREAGFAGITHRRLVPGMGFFSFLARKPD